MQASSSVLGCAFRNNSPYLSLGTAARLLGCHINTLRRWADGGEIECVVLPSGHRRVSRAAIAAFQGEELTSEENNEGSKICAYCRVSSEKQNQRGSLDRQVQRLISTIVERKQIEPSEIKVYKETCSSYSNRPILNALVSDIIGGRVAELWVENEDRLSRISSTTSLIYHLCKKYGVVVVCLDKEEEDEDELEAGMKELLSHAGIITARIHAKKSALVTRKEVTGECVARMVSLHKRDIRRGLSATS